MHLAPAMLARTSADLFSCAKKRVTVSKRSFASTQAGRAGAASAQVHGVERCGVVGAGQMGLGIAYVAAKVSGTSPVSLRW